MGNLITIISHVYYKLYVFFIRAKIKLHILREFLTKNTWYANWIAKNETIDRDKTDFSYKPLISIILPVYNVKEQFLRECIESVLLQSYTNWELCIADDCSTEAHVKEVLTEYSAFDGRIRVSFRKENGHISACSNTALSMVNGEFLALLDNDDILAPFALHEIVKVVNRNPAVDLMFSDEDKLMDGKRAFPFFKKCYRKELLYHVNFVCHLVVYRTSIVRKVEGFRIGYEGVQDWDLSLRVFHLTDNIIHIPKILYHWRISETSTAGGERRKNYIKRARKKMLSNLKVKG